jgi:hypothetical protein
MRAMLSKRVLEPLAKSFSLGHCHWLIAILLLCGAVGSAAGQPFKSDPIDKAARAYSASAKQWLSNPAAFAADKQHFDDYFVKYYFPDMTHAEDADLGQLGKKRYDLFKNYLWATNNPQLQQDLTDIALKKMGLIVVDAGYHPAVRYNAILLIGMLDEQYATAPGQTPKPLAKATRALTTVVDNATAKNSRFPPPIILGAIIGLERHAQLRASLTPEAVAAMTAALVKLVEHDAPIQEMDAEAYAWIRLRAAETLAKLGNVGEKNSVHNALVKLISSTKSLDDRCEAAGFLDKLDKNAYKDVKLDDATTAEPLFALARDVAAAEDKRAADFQNQYSGGGSVAPGPRPRGAEGFAPGIGGDEQQETYPRRQVAARLTSVRDAIARVKPSLPTETQTRADDLLKAINAARAAALDKNTIELKLAAAIRTMALAINKAVPAPAAAKAPPAKAAAAL